MVLNLGVQIGKHTSMEISRFALLGDELSSSLYYL